MALSLTISWPLAMLLAFVKSIWVTWASKLSVSRSSSVSSIAQRTLLPALFQARKAQSEPLSHQDNTARSRHSRSRYNDEKPCLVFGPDNGSHNACFFCRVEFPDDATKWVVQMPIELALHRPWDKLISEVATSKVTQTGTYKSTQLYLYQSFAHMAEAKA